MAVLACVSVAAGCSGIERANPGPSAGRAETSFLIDAPPIMRGTVASEAAFDGYRAVVVRGYGLVVGLDGTGSRDAPPAVRAHMLGEMARQGIGSERSGYGRLKPEAMLDSLDTSVVIVEGLIPPAAVEGARFDIRVYSDPRTATTSLEGGRLYTTPLFPALAGERFPPVGSRQPFPLAQGRGTMFINPFAEPGAMGRDSVNRTSGRVMNGGAVRKDLPLKLILATPSHTRASILQGTINARFPQEPGQRSETAHGESDESLAITVPPSFRDSTEDFVELLRHTTIRQSGVEAVAVSIRRYLMVNPSMAHHASWRWEALGQRVLPHIKDLYDYAEELPRLAALRAGAKLDDALVVPHLIEMAESGSPDARRQAIALLEDMQLNPQIDSALRGLLNDMDIEVRLLAYAALVNRRDPYMNRHAVDDKFLLDIVESDKPMIYITQVGQPRIVLFGADITLEAPITVRAWSNQLMIKGDQGEEQVEVYYRPPGSQEGFINRVEPDLEELVQFFGHQTTVEAPAPGLGLTYGQTVGALHQIWRQGYINADFKAEQDRILAAIMRQDGQRTIQDRPEFSTPEEDTPDNPAAGPGSNLQGALPTPAPELRPGGRHEATVPQ